MSTHKSISTDIILKGLDLILAISTIVNTSDLISKLFQGSNNSSEANSSNSVPQVPKIASVESSDRPNQNRLIQ
jgi:hypothetical protein